MGQITLLLIVAKTRRGQAKPALHCELRILCSQFWIAKCSVFAAQHRVTNPKLIQYLHCTLHRDTGRDPCGNCQCKLELSTNLREVSHCPQKSPTRTFSLSKVPTCLLLALSYFNYKTHLNTGRRDEIGMLMAHI